MKDNNELRQKISEVRLALGRLGQRIERMSEVQLEKHSAELDAIFENAETLVNDLKSECGKVKL